MGKPESHSPRFAIPLIAAREIAMAAAAGVRALAGLRRIIDQGEEAFAEMLSRPDFLDEGDFDEAMRHEIADGRARGTAELDQMDALRRDLGELAADAESIYLGEHPRAIPAWSVEPPAHAPPPKPLGGLDLTASEVLSCLLELTLWKREHVRYYLREAERAVDDLQGHMDLTDRAGAQLLDALRVWLTTARAERSP